MCMIDGGERYEVSTTDFRRARRPHNCGECGRVIQPGESYRFDTGLYEGHWNCHHTCQHCQVAMRWLSDNCGGWMFDFVQEDIAEHVGEYPALAFGLRRLTRGMERRWQRRDGAGLLAVPQMPRSIRNILEAA